jgi:Zn-dependent M28 family amino/carboxypeptidase
MRAKKNTLILADEAHQQIFNQYRNYFSKGNISLEQADEGSLVFALFPPAENPTFQVRASNAVETLKLSNVAGMIPGKDKKEEMVIFSAHYDHIGFLKPVNGDSIANGADDDASGTTAVLTLANYFKKQKNKGRTLVFVAFTAEEMGGYGSQYFSKQLDPEKVVAMFNIEMIGKPSKFGPNTAWVTGYEKTNFGKILQQNLQGTQFTFHPDPYPEQNLFYRSDNATLARLGVPAHSISSDQIDIDKLYHSVDDEYESLDIANMTQIIKAIAQSAASIISGKDTPTRVNASELK